MGPARIEAVLPILLFESSVPAPLPGGTMLAPLPGGMIIAAGFKPFPQWDRVRRFILDDRSFRRPELRPWTSWAAALQAQPIEARLQAINDRVLGRVAYVSDQIIWGRPNYWETPLEVVRQEATDCEGFAILDMFLAAAAGIDRQDMAILVGRVPSRNMYHAVLLVRAGGESYVLDSRWRSIHAIGDALDFVPIYAVGTDSAWSFGPFPDNTEVLAAAAP